jgi:spore maturation protein SpmA
MQMHLAAIDNSAYTTIDRDKSTQIGSISLNMDVKQIANDYDAKRAGEKAMEEMLRIARKSTTATIRR